MILENLQTKDGAPYITITHLHTFEIRGGKLIGCKVRGNDKGWKVYERGRKYMREEGN